MAERRAYTPFDRARFQRRLPCGVALGQKLLVLDQTESTQTALRAEHGFFRSAEAPHHSQLGLSHGQRFLVVPCNL